MTDRPQNTGGGEYYLWLDLETTGLDVTADSICEVAAILTLGAPDFTELDRFDGAVKEHEWITKRLANNEFVTAMHDTSGLRKAMQGPDAESLRVLDQCVATMLSKHLASGPLHLAGSGVSHFDLEWVRLHMSATAEWLHWRPLDVGQLEEWRILAGLPTFDQANPDQAARKTHRAMDDIAYHLDEARYYLGNWMRGTDD